MVLFRQTFAWSMMRSSSRRFVLRDWVTSARAPRRTSEVMNFPASAFSRPGAISSPHPAGVVPSHPSQTWRRSGRAAPRDSSACSPHPSRNGRGTGPTRRTRMTSKVSSSAKDRLQTSQPGGLLVLPRQRAEEEQRGHRNPLRLATEQPQRTGDQRQPEQVEVLGVEEGQREIEWCGAERRREKNASR